MHCLARPVAAAILWSTSVAAWPANAASWEPIDCAKSRLQVFPNAKCETMDSSGSGSKSEGAARIVSKSYSARGTYEGVIFNASLQKPESMGTFIVPRSAEERIPTIKSFNDVTKSGKNWSEPDRLGGTIVVTFETATRKCFGFHDYGPPKDSGYAHVVYGFFCRQQADTFKHDEMRELIGKVQVR